MAFSIFMLQKRRRSVLIGIRAVHAYNYCLLGAFLIPYVLSVILGGMPLFYLELLLGQYYRQGAITCWRKICPLLAGIGWAVTIIAFYTDFYYNVVISWGLYYLIASIRRMLPWSDCSMYSFAIQSKMKALFRSSMEYARLFDSRYTTSFSGKMHQSVE